MMDRNSNSLPEVYLSNALEIAHDPRSVPLEVCPSDAPELEYDPNAPEVLLAQGLECVDEEDGGNYTRKRHEVTISFDWLYKKWRWITLLVGFLFAGGIAGGVGGALGHTSSSRIPPTTSTNPPPTTSTTPPPTTSTTPPPTTSVTPPLRSRTLLPNTSITAAGCPSGDRWVFFQDSNGNITAAQYSDSASLWNFTSGYNFTNAKVGTALSASCVVNTNPWYAEYGGYAFINSGFNFTLLISLVYLDDSNVIQQSIYVNKTWINSPVYPAPSPPENGTKFSITTSIVDVNLYRSFYSTVAYESGLSFIMINLDPFDNNPRQPKINENLLSPFYDSAGIKSFQALYTHIGFACVYNEKIPDNTSNYFVRCYYQIEPPPNSQIFNSMWEYDLDLLYSNQSINATVFELANATYGDLDDSPPASVNADILIVPLPGNQSALVYLNLDNTIGISIGNTYINKTASLADINDIIPGTQGISSPSAIPFPNIAAISSTANSTTSSVICIYYQLNDTAIAEVTYNTTNQTWGAGPTIISFMEFFDSSGGFVNG